MLAPISPEADSTCRANISSSGTPLATWAATTDPADVPTSRSAAPRSTPASAKPRSRPTSQATPVTPPPPRTTARRNIRTRVARTVSQDANRKASGDKPTTTSPPPQDARPDQAQFGDRKQVAVLASPE